MVPIYPVWLITTEQSGPPGERLDTHSDERGATETGLVCVHIPNLLGMDILFSDCDDRFERGQYAPSACIVPCDLQSDHYKTCAGGSCGHTNELSCGYVHSDMGWWLVIKLPDDRKIWVHENDVPIDNHPDPGKEFFQRRPPQKLVDTTALTA